jgi:hypothetical protein
MFIDIMLIFDDEFIKFRNTQGEFDMQRATAVKDNMRTDSVPDIIYLLTQLMQNHTNLNKKVIKNAIKVIGQLIDWNSINLFTEPITVIMSNLISNTDFQSECFEVISYIVGKGMEPEGKLEVIKYLNVNALLEEILKYDNINENTMYNICEIITQMANFTVEYFAMLKGGKTDNGLLTHVIEVVNYCIYHSIRVIESAKNYDYKTAIQLHDFLTEFPAFLKTNSNICNLLKEILIPLAQSIENNLIIPKGYDLNIELNEEDDFCNFRKDFTTILLRLVGISYIKEHFVGNIITRFEGVVGGQASPCEMELALYLLFNLQSTIQNHEYENELVKKAVNYLFSINFSEVNSDMILLLYFETLLKYQVIILPNYEVLIYVIRLFLSQKGILNQNMIVGVKICNLFDKFLDKAKMLVTEIRSDIITSLMYLINTLIDSKNFLLLVEYNVIFHSLALVSIEKLKDNPEKQIDFYRQIFALFTKIVSIYGIDEEKFQELAKLITNYLKGFSYEVTEKTVFIEFLNAIYNDVYSKVITSEKAKYAMITILQRFIYILGKDSLNYIEYFLLNQIQYPNAEIYEDSIKLLHNITQLLKKESKGIVKKCFYLFFATIKGVNMPQQNISDEEKSILNIYMNFIKLIANLTHEDIVEIIFDPGLDNVNIDELINFLNFAASEIIDSSVRLQHLTH